MYNGDNLLYILTMLEAIEKVQRFSSKFVTAEDFFNAEDQLYFHASTHLLLAIGEESKKLEDDLKQQFSAIPWRAIAGMRNRLAHDYRGIDFQLVFSVIRQDLPELKKALVDMLPLISYDKAELEVALQSPFYKHLSYLRSI